MNGYKIMSKSYQMAADQGKMPAEIAEGKIKIYDFLATCNDQDIYNLFNSSAFNDIVKGYAMKAAKELEAEGSLTAEQSNCFIDRLSLLISEISAEKIVLMGVGKTPSPHK